MAESKNKDAFQDVLAELKRGVEEMLLEEELLERLAERDGVLGFGEQRAASAGGHGFCAPPAPGWRRPCGGLQEKRPWRAEVRSMLASGCVGGSGLWLSSGTLE